MYVQLRKRQDSFDAFGRTEDSRSVRVARLVLLLELVLSMLALALFCAVGNSAVDLAKSSRGVLTEESSFSSALTFENVNSVGRSNARTIDRIFLVMNKVQHGNCGNSKAHQSLFVRV
jgi:hypothetical protein